MSHHSPVRPVIGKFALVTGAASGIGRATALALAEHGASVACADLDPAGAEATASAIVSERGTAWSCALDVASEQAWQSVLDDLARLHGRLDIVVNCAGISYACPITDMPLEDWRRVMAVNLDGVMLGTKHAIRVMRQLKRPGSIVNVSSISGIKAQPQASAYCCSKAAVIMLSRSAALECLHNGDKIRINSVSPSGVKTPMWKTMPFFQELMAREGGEEAAFAAMAKMSPHSRWAEAEEIALAILFLASDESSYVNGTNLVIDNGDTG